MDLETAMAKALASEEHDPHVIALSLADDLDTDAIVALLARAIAHRQRDRVRAEEASVFRSKFVTTVNDQGVMMFEGGRAFTALMRERFAVSDNTSVTWGQATVEDHRARIALLRAKVEGILDTIARHETAVEMIEDAHVVCLNDLLRG